MSRSCGDEVSGEAEKVASSASLEQSDNSVARRSRIMLSASGPTSAVVSASAEEYDAVREMFDAPSR